MKSSWASLFVWSIDFGSCSKSLAPGEGAGLSWVWEGRGKEDLIQITDKKKPGSKDKLLQCVHSSEC